jgi:hypothetical protein
VASEDSEKEGIVLTVGATVVASEILPYEIGNALSARLKRRNPSVKQAMDVLEISRKIHVKPVSIDIGHALDVADDSYFTNASSSR